MTSGEKDTLKNFKTS